MVTEEDLYIGDLPDAELDIAADFLPFGDTNDSKKAKRITPTALKTKLSLNNVNNTSDANKPVSTAQQTALDAKQVTITGAATTIDTEDLTVSRALVSNGAGKVAVSDVTAAELAFLGGVTSAIQTQLDGKVDENAAITGATKTKITYDAKGLVTSGADATTADIAASTNKNYVTDAQLVVVGNTSGTNTGDNATNSQYSGLAASKEDSANKSTDVNTDQASNTKFPSVKAVYDWGVGLFATIAQLNAKLGFTAGATYTGSTTIVLTQAEYDAIGSKNANTIYFIV